MRKKSRKKRAVIHALMIYLMINGLVYGLLKVYLNSHNAVSREQWKMASVSKNGQAAEITVLDNSFTLDLSAAEEGIPAVCIYTVMTDKAKLAARFIMHFGQAVQRELQMDLL
ncbi:MAG: hypothetical protein ACI4I9_06510 [Porcipelethomonas sp.]